MSFIAAICKNKQVLVASCAVIGVSAVSLIWYVTVPTALWMYYVLFFGHFIKPSLMFYIFDPRVYDVNGRRLPGIDSHFEDPKKSFFSIMKKGRKKKQTSKTIHEEIFHQCGDGNIVAVDLFKMRKIVLVSHPDYVKDICKATYKQLPKSTIYDKFKFMVGEGLLTSNGALWQAHRKMVSPGFEAAEFEYFSDVFIRHTKVNLLDRWAGKSSVDLNVDLTFLTSNIICESAFGAKMGEKIDESFLASLVELGYEINERIVELADWTHKIYFSRQRRVNHVMGEVTALINAIIDDRIALRSKCPTKKSGESVEGSVKGCLLDILLDASDSSDEKLSKTELLDHTITFFAAGHETTASALLWCFYELCRNENKLVYRKCIDEIDRIFNDKLGKDLTYSDVPKFVYLQQFTKEILRLHPTFPTLARRTSDDTFQLGEYKLPADTQIAICLYSLHRHRDFWDEPEVLNPDRFASGYKLKHNFQYMPFSNGHRSCIGQKFANTEMIIILAHILRHYTVSMTEEALSNVCEEEHISAAPKNMQIDIAPRMNS